MTIAEAAVEIRNQSPLFVNGYLIGFAVFVAVAVLLAIIDQMRK